MSLVTRGLGTKALATAGLGAVQVSVVVSVPATTPETGGSAPAGSNKIPGRTEVRRRNVRSGLSRAKLDQIIAEMVKEEEELVAVILPTII